MTSQAATVGRGFRLLGKALFSVLIVFCVTNAACPRMAEAPPDREPTPFPELGPQEIVKQERKTVKQERQTVKEQRQTVKEERPKYDVKPRNIDRIPPGTVVAKEPPKGWSHLVIKSRPCSTGGDDKKLNANSKKLCTMLFTAMLANVQAEKSGDKVRHRLSGLAVGLGTLVGDKDTIISPNTYAKLGAKLPFLGPTVLTQASAKLDDITIVARSDTMAIVDGPGYLTRGDRHVSVMLRYALLVNRATGDLDTLLWSIDRDAKGNYKEAAGQMQFLQKSKVEDYVLHVNGKEIGPLGVPSDTAFAMNKMITGKKQIPLADALKAKAAKARLTADEVYDLETKLREALKKASD